MESVAQLDFNYQKPDDLIYSLADALPAPSIRLRQDAKKAVLLYRNNYKSIEELSAPEMKLAGQRINPATYANSRLSYFVNLKVLDVALGLERQVDGLPPEGKYTQFIWSNDQSMMAFSLITSKGLELWILDVDKASAKKLTESILNSVLGTPYIWSKDDRYLLVNVLLENRSALKDVKSVIPSGPMVMENEGQKAQNRTYQDLLKNKTDEFNFENLITSEIVRIDLAGRKSIFKPAAMHAGMNFSPDGQYVLVYEHQKPFSYLVTSDRFPTVVDIYTNHGKFVKNVVKIPLIEELPKGFMAVRKGPRSIQWRADKAATLYWVEALDEGDPAIETAFRDEVFLWQAPFTQPAFPIIKTKDRYAGIQWTNKKLAIISDYWWNTRKIRTMIFDPDDSNFSPILFNERNQQDKYADPGSFVTKRNEYQLNTVDIADDHMYLIGEGFTPQGKFPFVDKYRIQDLQKQRLYQAENKDVLEEIISAVDLNKGVFLTRLESKSDFPDYFLRNIQTNALVPITKNDNPFKILDHVYKEVIQYKRPDGVELSAKLYLPVGYNMEKKEKLPMIMWAYPTEYKDKSSASQVTSNVNEFTYPYYGSPLFWLTKGYAILDDASFPIVGEGKNEPNDTFIAQLVANAKAAIDAVDSLGFINRSRVAVGGHSYGAFMTANLLTHSNLFAAGIARSGAYNRTLTPFGFQSEERNYWEAPDVYDAVSPFQHANKMKVPLLLIHGEEDNNPGTHTMQSERYFNALKGLGATARYVVLPKESHGYAAKESIMHMLWEQDQWLEKYVKQREVMP